VVATACVQIQHFVAKQSTRDEIKVAIKNYLWDESTGFPGSFDENEIAQKAEDVFIYMLVHARSDSIQASRRTT
jgi:type I restriction enzyme, R subunit